MESFGFTLFGFAIPMFAAFVANSIGGKTALAAGFIGGYVANKPIAVIGMVDGVWDKITPVPSGFLGAFIIAFIVGYFVKYLNKNIKTVQFHPEANAGPRDTEYLFDEFIKMMEGK